MLRKIDCVMLHAESLDTAIDYYQRVFGLHLHWRNGLQAGLGMPETDAEIVLYSGPKLPPGARVHYLTDDVTSAVEQLAARGCTSLVAPFEVAIGMCAVVSDPFGNSLAILDMTKGPLPEGYGLIPSDTTDNES
jgi:predicted enzyme related to lactoylglutathione lyase